jgi:hypothetical protein
VFIAFAVEGYTDRGNAVVLAILIQVWFAYVDFIFVPRIRSRWNSLQLL